LHDLDAASRIKLKVTHKSEVIDYGKEGMRGNSQQLHKIPVVYSPRVKVEKWMSQSVVEP
jgi:hypothetical protein